MMQEGQLHCWLGTQGASPLPASDARTTASPPGASAGAQGIIGDVRASTSSPIIDIGPISAVPGGVEEDLVRDQTQIDRAPKGSGTSGAQVPVSSSSSPRLPQREIDWNDTPWQEDIFDDNEDMQAMWTSIVTINVALTVSLLLVLFLMMYF
jgi:hypothetical protein